MDALISGLLNGAANPKLALFFLDGEVCDFRVKFFDELEASIHIHGEFLLQFFIL